MLAAGLLAACGREPAPWTGFALFPDAGAGAHEAPPLAPITTAVPPPPSAGSMPAAMSGGAGSSAPAFATAPDATTPAAPSAFRITELSLRDPHVFVGANDITERSLLGMSLNHDVIASQLTADADGDGLLDYSVVLLIAPYEPAAATASLRMLRADCPKNASAPCKPSAGQAPLASFEIANRSSPGSCLAPLPGSTSNYQPPITTPEAPCFASDAALELRVDLGGVQLDISAARVGASYAGVLRGLLSGFVTQQAAMRAILPRDTAGLLAGTPLSRYVRQKDYDLATSPNQQDGFWLYLNFVAEPVVFSP